ncbi:MAG: nucleoside phosphorylase [Firmicutes bacterium]|nr:nucleoside phosphorylase [Bacillota bacterium]
MDEFKDIPILDGFYECIPFLTPEKAIGDKEGKQANAKKRIRELGITTVVMNWLSACKVHHYKDLLSKCELILESTLGKLFIYNNKALLLFLPIGAPNAAASVEELRWMGVTKFVGMGSAGCIDQNFDANKVLVVDKAIRDEGTSYHYLSPSLYIETSKDMTGRLSNFLQSKNIGFANGITWTTDAFYRETKSRIEKRISQGAVCVEMESSAIASVCKFYEMEFCQFLYFSDIVKQDSWSWQGSNENRLDMRDKMLRLALEFAICE